MVILTNKQWEKIEKQLDKIEPKVDQTWFNLNSISITYSCDWIKANIENNRERQRLIDELIKSWIEIMLMRKKIL